MAVCACSRGAKLPAFERRTSNRATGLKQLVRLRELILPAREADAHSAPLRRITTGDFVAVASLLLLGMVSWLVPVKWLWPISRSIGRGTALWHRSTPTAPFIGGLLSAHDVSWAAPDIHTRY